MLRHQESTRGFSLGLLSTARRFTAAAACLMLAFALAACGSVELPPPLPSAPPPVVYEPPSPVPQQLPPQPYFDQVGIASWYGSRHHGRRTASGERFDMQAMTAAHRTLPMDTVVRVTNLENNRTVMVRINDRGPYVPGRVIDLSSEAARALGMHRKGLARVRIEAFEADQIWAKVPPSAEPADAGLMAETSR